ncbi:MULTISPECIES: nickel-dependent lactate racemase family protein [Methanosarcina]|uniref:Transcriptional regulator n=2 Tax=Methanosarcina barkeri TaxID=2208 RepID=A0A0E3QT00_METBA|nr:MULTISPECIES: nickel-dependent lactate racemase [Methanosarcina]AKB54047.1 Transcriptional regulator [Methanosarcina barkeri MS]AKB57878.1 Transcriptional regulator [Methanosarcina barkeri 227]OEC90801.1 transcriptional regulator [Methanosarcina sp. A14]
MIENTKTISLAFGSTALELDIPERNVSSIILPSEPEKKEDPTYLIKKALENPIKSKRISEIVNPDSKVAIIVSDVTRPTPTAKLLPSLLEELYLGGIKDENITIVFALGLHRNQTEEESRKLVGEEVYKKIRCIQHDTGRCRRIGITSRGTPIEVFEDIMDADVVIGTGSIEFHYYAGYSGGAKSILPGVSSKETVITNHKMMIDEKAVSGRVDGPVRQDMEEAAKIFGLDFILNVVLDSKKKIVAAVAGDFIEAHRKGVEVVDSMYKVSVEPADAVIVSCGGFPKDINLFQANKALDNATQAVKAGGSIILVAECAEGIGNQVYECWNRECRSPDDAIERFKKCFEFGGHKTAIIAKTSKRFKLYLVSKLSDEQTRNAFFTPMVSVEEALSAVLSENPDAKIHLMPHGGQTLPVRKEN